jgi:hypothetical protein
MTFALSLNRLFNLFRLQYQHKEYRKKIPAVKCRSIHGLSERFLDFLNRFHYLFGEIVVDCK